MIVTRRKIDKTFSDKMKNYVKGAKKLIEKGTRDAKTKTVKQVVDDTAELGKKIKK